jgi:hypothetical protein
VQPASEPQSAGRICLVENDRKKAGKDLEGFAGSYRPVRTAAGRGCRPGYIQLCVPAHLPGGNEPEENRVYLGCFLCRGEDFVGAECEDGMVPAHEKYRILLTEDERKKLAFWRYFAHEAGEQARMGLIEVKYFSNAAMARLLRDILLLRRGTADSSCARSFLTISAY